MQPITMKLAEAGWNAAVTSETFGPYGQTRFADRRQLTSFIGEVDSSDASAGAAIALYDWLGNVITVGATDRVVVTNVSLTSAISGKVTLYVANGGITSPAAGTSILVKVGTGFTYMIFDPGRFAAPGAGLRVAAAGSGQINAIIHGWIAPGVQ